MSQESHRSLLDDDVDLMSEVAEGILERDRQRMRREVLRWMSFVCAVLSWCGSSSPCIFYILLMIYI